MQLTEAQITSLIKEVSKRVLKEHSIYLAGRQLVKEGTWGVDPMDSDSAMDDRSVIIQQTFGKIVDLFRLCQDLTSKWGMVGNSIEFAKALKGKYFMSHVKEVKAECLETIQAIEKDEDWLSGWKHPEEIKAQVEKTKKELETVFEDNAVDGHDD